MLFLAPIPEEISPNLLFSSLDPTLTHYFSFWVLHYWMSCFGRQWPDPPCLRQQVRVRISVRDDCFDQLRENGTRGGFFLLGSAAPTLCWRHKGGTPAQSWLGIVRATGPDPLRHCLRPDTHLHYMPLCEATPAGFANWVYGVFGCWKM